MFEVMQILLHLIVFVDTADLDAVTNIVGSAIIFMHLTVKWVVLSFIFSFFSFLESFCKSSLLYCLFTLISSNNTSIVGALFIFLCLFFLHAIFITFDEIVHIGRIHLESVDSSDWCSVGECSASVTIMECAVELVVFFLMFSFLFFLLGL